MESKSFTFFSHNSMKDELVNLTENQLNELRAFYVERYVDNMETKDLVQYVMDDMMQYMESLPDNQVVDSYNWLRLGLSENEYEWQTSIWRNTATSWYNYRRWSLYGDIIMDSKSFTYYSHNSMKDELVNLTEGQLNELRAFYVERYVDNMETNYIVS